MRHFVFLGNFLRYLLRQRQHFPESAAISTKKSGKNVQKGLKIPQNPQPATACHSLPQPATACHSLPQPAAVCRSLPQPAAACRSLPQISFRTSERLSQPENKYLVLVNVWREQRRATLSGAVTLLLEHVTTLGLVLHMTKPNRGIERKIPGSLAHQLTSSLAHHSRLRHTSCIVLTPAVRPSRLCRSPVSSQSVRSPLPMLFRLFRLRVCLTPTIRTNPGHLLLGKIGGGCSLQSRR